MLYKFVFPLDGNTDYLFTRNLLPALKKCTLSTGLKLTSFPKNHFSYILVVTPNFILFGNIFNKK